MSDHAAAGEEAVAALRHDLRTPLNQIIGYSELVAEDLEGEAHTRTREDLEKIGRAARGLAELITREIQPGRVSLHGASAMANPRAEGAVAHSSGGGTTTSEEEVVVPSAVTARILIVDDQPENCIVLQRRLEKEGHRCVAVHDGEAALARLAVEAFDLVLLDIMMPGMDGREVLRRIKTDENLRHIPVIMISALDQIESVVACIERGAEDYLPKPFNPVLLRARIGSSLDRKRLRDAEQAAFAALKDSQEKLAAELSEAAAYVQSVLPPPIKDGPVGASWQFLPSSSLGGDAFGYGSPREGTFGISLLDVCGHGVGAALLSISVLNVIRAESLPGVDFTDPGAVLAGLNAAFPMERHGEMFFTAWSGIYDHSSRRMRFAAGGHPPAIMVLPDGTTSILAAKGPVIGACEGMKFVTQEIFVPVGARIFVFSDGAYEIRQHGGTMMGHDDLRALLAKSPREGATSWAMDQLRAINSQPEFDDDVSLVELSFL
ncbi:MAG: SpoIIE family protein phosphatase [Chthoniobacterales bacterium]|nr:SpoIIE family protein phosphatase [Chthoniobacterales bacterium]